jgi:hypothetical protein
MVTFKRDAAYALLIVAVSLASLGNVQGQMKNPALDLNQDQRFLFALRESAISANVKINRVDAEQENNRGKAIEQSSWRVSATGEAQAIMQWTNTVFARFDACGMKQLQLQRTSVGMKNFEATMVWVCFNVAV